MLYFWSPVLSQINWDFAIFSFSSCCFLIPSWFFLPRPDILIWKHKISSKWSGRNEALLRWGFHRAKVLVEIHHSFLSPPTYVKPCLHYHRRFRRSPTSLSIEIAITKCTTQKTILSIGKTRFFFLSWNPSPHFTLEFKLFHSWRNSLLMSALSSPARIPYFLVTLSYKTVSSFYLKLAGNTFLFCFSSLGWMSHSKSVITNKLRAISVFTPGVCPEPWKPCRPDSYLT